MRLDGTVRGKAREREIARLREGGSLLVMTTPESLGSEEIADALAESGVSLAAIDEAHCISEWGYDFRPAYQRLGERLRALGAPPLMGLTATATENVRRDIVRFLGMRDAVVVSSSHRIRIRDLPLFRGARRSKEDSRGIARSCPLAQTAPPPEDHLFAHARGCEGRLDGGVYTRPRQSSGVRRTDLTGRWPAGRRNV